MSLLPALYLKAAQREPVRQAQGPDGAVKKIYNLNLVIAGWPCNI